jgi:large subunit ribosomal protein L15
MNLTNLKPRPGARHRVKRLGCGESSGHGKTSGKGHKGQKARSGGSIRLGFEGGQMPLIRRVPKRGFNNAVFKTKWVIRRPFEGVKILAFGELKKKLSVVANHASAAAKAAIEKLGGTLTIN